MVSLTPSLRSALLASLLTHALVLAGGRWAAPPTPAAPLPGLQAQLRAGPAAPEPVSASPPAATPQPTAAPPSPPSPRIRPAPVLAMPAAAGPAVAAAAAAPSLPASAPAATAEAGGGGGTAAPGEGRTPPPEAASGDALRQYRLALAVEARRFKRYPRLARERGWEGTVAVQVILGSAGGPALARVQRGSGYGLLDEQGLDMLNRALAATPVPEALRGREISILLPIEFSLEE